MRLIKKEEKLNNSKNGHNLDHLSPELQKIISRKNSQKFDLKTVAKFFNIHVSSVGNMIKAQKLDCIKEGRRKYVTREALQKFIWENIDPVLITIINEVYHNEILSKELTEYEKHIGFEISDDVDVFELMEKEMEAKILKKHGISPEQVKRPRVEKVDLNSILNGNGKQAHKPTESPPERLYQKLDQVVGKLDNLLSQFE